MADEAAGRDDAWGPGTPRAALLAALAWQVELGIDAAPGEVPLDRFAEEAARRAAAEAAPRPTATDAPARPGAAASPPARGPSGAPSHPAAPPARPGEGPSRAAVAPSRPAGAPAPPRAAPAGAPAQPRAAPAGAPAPATAEALLAAREAAAAAPDLPALHAAIRAFEGCPLKRGARSTVIADGRPGARLMIVGEAPGRDEDRLGKPFVGASGRLLDRMLIALGLSREAEDPARAAYITNVVYWRPLENRRPSTDEISMLLPFLERHLELAAPQAVLLCGAAPAQALLGTELGITRLRGRWRRWRGLPVLPTFHPAYLLRQPLKKREVWRDLLAMRAVLDGEEVPE